ncbi:hypothetical protein [Shewanella fodinae]|uniref:hypothetical protein n=1 Tax=Shewanella fodinae TaxID=552357 RepID=UPI0016744A61|nr:hypothetical protein [Shewanella fodinae]MCL2906778.1 hypothetical protein [Shewanella fodinae]GGZ02476.1 hypothetical protein GCM10007169_19070 [Shewanella fodinae]
MKKLVMIAFILYFISLFFIKIDNGQKYNGADLMSQLGGPDKVILKVRLLDCKSYGCERLVDTLSRVSDISGLRIDTIENETSVIEHVLGITNLKLYLSLDGSSLMRMDVTIKNDEKILY